MANGNGFQLDKTTVSVGTLWTAIVAVVSVALYVGNLPAQIQSVEKFAETRAQNLEKRVDAHEDKPAHTTTVQDVATIKALVGANQAAILRLERQADKDKDEILKAIKELDK